jgi:hypothetical protein
LIAEESGDEDEFVGIDRHDTIEDVGEDWFPGDADKRFRLAPGLGSKPCAKSRHRQNDIHAPLR